MAYLRPTVKGAKNAHSDLGTEKTSLNLHQENKVYEITDLVIKKLNQRYRDIAPEDISRLIDAILDDIPRLENEIKKLTKENYFLQEKYENLKAIKINSANPVLFPQQKHVTLHTMLSKKAVYLEEQLKKADLALASLKSENAKLKAYLNPIQLEHYKKGEE